MLPPRLYTYLLLDLDSAPDVLARMLRGTANPAAYDARPDPARFTLREVVAHLADWEAVFLRRLTTTRDEDDGVLQGLDEGRVALDHDYAHADPSECLARYKLGRTAIVSFLRALAPEQWQQAAVHTELGPITLETQAILIAAHDGYHRQQTLEWIGDGAE